MKPLLGGNSPRITREIENPVKYYITHNMGGSTGGQNSGKIFVQDAELGTSIEVDAIECVLLAIRYKAVAVKLDKTTAFTSYEKRINGNSSIALFIRKPGQPESRFQMRGTISAIEEHLKGIGFPSGTKMKIVNTLYVLYRGEIATLEISGGDTARFIKFSESNENPAFKAFQGEPEGQSYWLTFQPIEMDASDFLENEKVKQLGDFMKETDAIEAHYNSAE